MNDLNKLENNKKLTKSAIIIFFVNFFLLAIMIGIFFLICYFLAVDTILNLGNEKSTIQTVFEFLLDNKWLMSISILVSGAFIILSITSFAIHILLITKIVKNPDIKTILILLCIGLIISICAVIGDFLLLKHIKNRINIIKDNHNNEENSPEFYI